MRMLAFSRRVAREVIRDPLNIAFGMGLPVAVLALMYAISTHAPAGLFSMVRIAPGIAVFALSFLTLFSASLIAKDRAGAFLQRLYATPLTALDCILGYALPMLPLALAQAVVCFAAAVPMGLHTGMRLPFTVLAILPTALLYTSLGLLCGSLLSDKQVGGVCGALLTNLTAWLSGAWFDVSLVGGAFERIARALPFFHAVELERAALAGSGGLSHLGWVLGYALLTTALAVFAFLRQRERI